MQNNTNEIKRAVVALTAVHEVFGKEEALAFAMALATGSPCPSVPEQEPEPAEPVEPEQAEPAAAELEPAKEESQALTGTVDGFHVEYSERAWPVHRWSVRAGYVLRRKKTGQEFVVLQVGDDNPRGDICVLLSNTYKDYKGEMTAGLNLTRSNNAWFVVGQAIGDEVPS